MSEPKELLMPSDELIDLPPDYIDEWIQGEDRKLLEIYYTGELSEGGSADEVNLRAIKAVIAAALRAVVQQIDHSWDGAECVDFLQSIAAELGTEQ